LRVRVAATSDGSAKPAEVARALGVTGLVARLGVVEVGARPLAAAPALREPARL
jgi:hypothetical protein